MTQKPEAIKQMFAYVKKKVFMGEKKTPEHRKQSCETNRRYIFRAHIAKA